MVEADSYSSDPRGNEAPLAALLRDIPGIVRLAYNLRDLQPTVDTIEEVSHELLVLLLEDDYRRLRSFDARKSSFKTWLSAVVMHHVSRRVARQKHWRTMDEVALEKLTYMPTQERDIACEEEVRRMRAASEKLSRRERQLFGLLCQDGASAEQIASEMGIKVESVYRRKHCMVKKLQRLLGLSAPDPKPASARARF